MEKVRIMNGDCLELLRTMADNSIDSIVTDPPYELGFMGKSWDSTGIAYNVELWKECMRVLKHGGYLLAFGGTRTYHRMTCAIEDSGFEIRDMIEWLYGSGYPKSLNVGKEYDKKMGNDREVIGELKLTGTARSSDIGGKTSSAKSSDYEIKNTKTDITQGSSPYEGWGTALKPAHEPICMARKPLIGTVVENVLKYGTGGINIDGCRVGTEEDQRRPSKGGDNGLNGSSTFKIHERKVEDQVQYSGRFPANLIHDGSDEVVALFPNSKSTSNPRNNNNADNHDNYNCFGKYGNNTTRGFDDEGSAARFFYCAKASKSERNFGLEGFEENMPQHDFGTKLGVKRSERIHTPTKNFHPTVKPIALMRYLCRLVTPKGGTVLDPFTGSGTTGIAAKLEGFNFIGIEREAEYVQIANARIEAWAEETTQDADNQLALDIL